MRKSNFPVKALSVILSSAVALTSIPLNSFAEQNHSPEIVQEYLNAAGEKVVEINQKYLLDLDEVFWDRDGDKLTYYMKMGNGMYLRAGNRCVYTPDETGEAVLTFKASDGKSESAEYSVTITAVEEGTSYDVNLSDIESDQTSTKLSSLIIHTGNNPTDDTVLIKNSTDEYTSGLTFDACTTEYTLAGTIYDNNSRLGFRAVPEYAKAKVTLSNEAGLSEDIKLGTGISIYKNFLTAGKNVFSIIVAYGTESTTYKFDLDVIPTLSSLTAEEDILWKDDVTFSPSVQEYTIVIPKSAETLTLQAKTTTEEGCEITYNESSSNVVDVSETDKIEITVTKDGISNTYTLNLEKKVLGTFSIEAEPEDAIVSVYDPNGVRMEADEDGSYTAFFGEGEYTYTVSKDGYVTQSGTVPEIGGTVQVTLEKILGEQPEEVDAQWENFRNSDVNMAITDVSTPRSEDADSISAKWIKKIGSDAYPSVQIIVDDALVVMSGTVLYKIDLETGDVLQQAEMAAAPNYGYTPPTYAKGMIFCPLANGTIQAFNATTLESLWIYQDELEGQSLSPITYSDGYIYTGFWNGEEKDANFVCINIADEDVDSENETKEAVWKYRHRGGFYWAGAVGVVDAVIVGTDNGLSDGDAGTSKLFAFNKKDGSIISEYDLTNAGDQRSSIAYDKENGKIYFTTKGGFLYSASVNASIGVISNLKSVQYDGASTSTPVVYNGRVYFGLGKGFETGYLIVADANTLGELFRVSLKGYPQGSVLLSNAYESESGYLYLYSTYNNPPGGISVIKVKSDCKSASDAELTELYDASGYEQYCITSIICSEDGTLYYKNDSGNVFAIGIPTIQNVLDLIEAIGTVTLESEGAITAAREAYDALSASAKKQIPTATYKILTNAESAFAVLKANSDAAKAVEALIKAIGTVTLESEAKIEKAEKAYAALNSSAKKMVSSDYVTKLENARTKYDKLEKEAVANVEKLITDIGTVTLESESSIKKARAAYDALPETVQELVTNYAKLVAAEKKLAELKEEEEEETKTTSTQTVSTKTAVTGTTTAKKSEFLQMQDELEKVTEDITYEDALELIKKYYSLEEEKQLAFTDSEGLEILHQVIQKTNHEDADTGILLTGADWNIRLVVEKKENEKLVDELSEKLEDGKIAALWDIYLENVLTGERYQPEEAVEIRIPLELIESYETYDSFSILHYGNDKTIEILNGEMIDDYLCFHTIDFSYYAAVGHQEADELIEVTVEEKGGLSWMFWAALAGLGIGLLGVLIFLLIRDAEDSEEDALDAGEQEE